MTPLLTPTKSEEGVGLNESAVLYHNVALRLCNLCGIVAEVKERRVLGVAVCLVCGRGSRLVLFGKASSEAVT